MHENHSEQMSCSKTLNIRGGDVCSYISGNEF